MKELKKPTAAVLKTFENRLGKLASDQIIDLSKHDNGVFNVVRGIHPESFGTIVYDTSKQNFPYYIIYTRNINSSLTGYILELQPFLKSRNELTACFSKFICQEFNIKEGATVFNTYQDQQQTLFERLNYWTYGNDLLEMFKNQKPVMVLKGKIGTMYVPFVDTTSKTVKSNSKKETVSNANPNDQVYLMLNEQNGYYKIGRSNRPEFRERTLQAQEPDIKLIDSWFANKNIERVLHRKFKDKRIRGEWFNLSDQDLEELKVFMLMITNNKRKHRTK